MKQGLFGVQNALVLSGGDLKGAWQAGAIQGITEGGRFQPDWVGGISVGALNTGLLASLYGRAVIAAAEQGFTLQPGGQWEVTGQLLADAWRKYVTSPSALVKKRSALDLAARMLTNKWAGLTNMDGLRRTVELIVKPSALAQCPFPAVVGAVCLETGALRYTDLRTARMAHDWIMASTAIPVMMPPVKVPGVHGTWVDGGIRDNAPLSAAIHAGADKIVVIATDPAQFPATAPDWDAGSAMGQTSRAIQIMVSEVLQNDIEHVHLINAQVAAGIAEPHHRHIDLTVIRPSGLLPVRSVTKFTATDISAMLADGYATGRATQINAGVFA